MSGDIRTAVVLLEAPGALSIEPLKIALQKVAQSFTIKAVSGVYRHNVRDGLLMAVSFDAELSPEKLHSNLSRIVSRKAESTVQFIILLLGSEIFVTPSLTVPSPKLVENVEALSLSCELGGEMVHPVLELSLSELLEQYPSSEWGEFFARGKSLLPPPI